MFKIIFSLLLCSTFLHASSRVFKPQALAFGASHGCMINDYAVKCWGQDNAQQLKVPALANPRAIAAGGSTTCVLDDPGIKCWGLNNFGQANPPTVMNPKALSMGYNHGCVLDQAGVRCWGYNADGQTDVPKLKYPRGISTGSSHSCAIDDDGVKCWGYMTQKPPRFLKAQSIFSGIHFACGIDVDGLVLCWGDSRPSIPLEKFDALAAAANSACAVKNDSSLVQCWSGNQYRGSYRFSSKAAKLRLAIGPFAECIIDDDGPYCWHGPDVPQD